MNPIIKTLGNSSNYKSLITKMKDSDLDKVSMVGRTDGSKAW